jgi:hypothetical protein
VAAYGVTRAVPPVASPEKNRNRVPPILYLAGALLALFALVLWARRRTALTRVQAGERSLDVTPGAADAEAADRRAARAARSGKSRAASPQRSSSAPAEAPVKSVSATPAEQAAAGLDPIEELMSHIVLDAPAAKQESAPAPRPRIRRWSAPLSVRYPSEADSIAQGVPLRELVIAWYESRGYRGSPASPAIWPIEMVLRHRDDAARAYAFVVQNDYVSVDRITALVEQAREIGMLRLTIVAQAGYEKVSKPVMRKRHVRLIDRSTMEAELLALELPTAAKIIGVARKRAAEAPVAA